MGGLLDGDASIVAQASTIFAFKFATNRITGNASNAPFDVPGVLFDEVAKLQVRHSLK